jgi:hypothetical protein
MLSTRRLTDKKVPPLMHGMAFRIDWNDWGIARAGLPPDSSPDAIGPRTRWNRMNQGARW